MTIVWQDQKVSKIIQLFSLSFLVQGCTGGDSCCSGSDPCFEGEGDCDSNSDCVGDLVCGNNNCRNGRLGGLGGFDGGDDCCIYPNVTP